LKRCMSQDREVNLRTAENANRTSVPKYLFLILSLGSSHRYVHDVNVGIVTRTLIKDEDWELCKVDQGGSKTMTLFFL